jgi:hypothetical protein
MAARRLELDQDFRLRGNDTGDFGSDQPNLIMPTVKSSESGVSA